MTEFLFSYGTLQLEKVQLASFGRVLKGTEDILTGYKLEKVRITDKEVLKKSEQEFHPIAICTNDKNDKIKGTLYKISTQELKEADSYEVADYTRVLVTFESKKQGWIYIKS